MTDCMTTTTPAVTMSTTLLMDTLTKARLPAPHSLPHTRDPFEEILEISNQREEHIGRKNEIKATVKSQIKCLASIKQN